MLQQWRAVGNTVSDLTGLRFELQTSRFRDERVINKLQKRINPVLHGVRAFFPSLCFFVINSFRKNFSKLHSLIWNTLTFKRCFTTHYKNLWGYDVSKNNKQHLLIYFTLGGPFWMSNPENSYSISKIIKKSKQPIILDPAASTYRNCRIW